MLRFIAAIFRRKREPEFTELTDMQRIFMLSPANGAPYLGDKNLPRSIEWPRQTWLQHRRRKENRS